MINHAHPTPSTAAASFLGAATPSLELLEARQLRDALKLLLRTEQAAMADFLVALAEFDRRRGWEPLGHANLFSFLVAELGLSKSAAYYRRSAAELLQVFPEVIEPLRAGRLCLSTIGELAKVLTKENRAVVTPRFFGLSSREAQELVAEFQPRHVPSTRMVVTRVLDLSVASPARSTQPRLALTAANTGAAAFAAASPTIANPNEAPLWRFPTSGIANGGGADLGAGVHLSRRDEIVPLTADVRRVHFNVGTPVVKKLEAARAGLAHAIPGATMEQVLEAALDLLLEKQARARGQVKRPRGAAPAANLTPTATATPDTIADTIADTTPDTTDQPGPSSSRISGSRPEGRAIRRDAPRAAIPAAVRRAVWARDAGRCSWPLDGGGCCGSTHRLELDHIIPWAEWGGETEANLRITCAAHNRLAARQAFGERVMGRYSGVREPVAEYAAPAAVRGLCVLRCVRLRDPPTPRPQPQPPRRSAAPHR
jgi:hypothetical protein